MLGWMPLNLSENSKSKDLKSFRRRVDLKSFILIGFKAIINYDGFEPILIKIYSNSGMDLVWGFEIQIHPNPSSQTQHKRIGGES